MEVLSDWKANRTLIERVLRIGCKHLPNLEMR